MAATTAIAGVSMLASAGSAYAKSRAGKKQQQMFETNAAFADWQAGDALERGRIGAKLARQQTEQVIGAQRTSFATQYIDVNRGSALDVQADAAYLGELDIQTIRNNAAKEAFGYKVQAGDLRTKGDYARQEGNMDAINTLVGGGSSLLLSKYGGGPYTLFSPGFNNNTTAPSTGRRIASGAVK